MQDILRSFFDLIQEPTTLTKVCIFYVVSYYLASSFFVAAHNRNDTTGILRKGGVADVTTSVIWGLAALFLIASLLELAAARGVSLTFLAIYYVFFVFLFAFIFGLSDWHLSDGLENVSPNPWIAECQYLIFSVENMATLGHSRVTSKNVLIDGLSAVQSILGLVLIVVFVAKAVVCVG